MKVNLKNIAGFLVQEGCIKNISIKEYKNRLIIQRVRLSKQEGKKCLILLGLESSPSYSSFCHLIVLYYLQVMHDSIHTLSKVLLASTLLNHCLKILKF